VQRLVIKRATSRIKGHIVSRVEDARAKLLARLQRATYLFIVFQTLQVWLPSSSRSRGLENGFLEMLSF
jgi:hypothetical protein